MKIKTIFGVVLSLLLFSACNEYEIKDAVTESTFLTGITIGYYDDSANNNTHGKQIIKSTVSEYDYIDPEVIIDSVFVDQSEAESVGFSLENAWVTLSVGNGSVEMVDDAPELGVPGNFSSPVTYRIRSVYGEEKLYKIVFKIK